jgi:2-oxoglutarate ferredoxin oxidoreductase subunit alpha
LKTIWPFPEETVKKLAEKVDSIIVVEMNFGKMVKEVQRNACDRANVVSHSKVGGQLPTASEILEEIKRCN